MNNKDLFICNNADDIPGWTRNSQHILFGEVINSINKKNPKVLEIGVGWGRSTWAWLDVLPKDAEFSVIDWFTVNPIYNKVFNYPIYHPDKLRKFYYECNYNNRQIFENYIIQHENINVLKSIYEEDFFEWKEKNIKDFDVVYTDACHSRKLEQLEYFSNVPIVCGDDINWKEVDNDVKEYCNKNKKEYKVWYDQGFFAIYN